jgi:hypothetical protein
MKARESVMRAGVAAGSVFDETVFSGSAAA